MPNITFIGDVHGRIPEYREIIKGCGYSIPLGDMGFDYSPLRDIDPERHRFVPGNHENYRELIRLERRDWKLPLCYGSEYDLHDLHGYGTVRFAEMFVTYIRGGYSIDKHLRTPGHTRYTDTVHICFVQYEVRLHSWFVGNRLT
jgi:hypothetical protein